jgi:hypothetical protein
LRPKLDFPAARIDPMSTQPLKPDDFARQAALDRPSFLAEFWSFLRYNKKWWLTPIVLVLLLMGLLIALTGTSAAPFIYTLF